MTRFPPRKSSPAPIGSTEMVRRLKTIEDIKREFAEGRVKVVIHTSAGVEVSYPVIKRKEA